MHTRTRAVFVCPAKGVRARQRHDLLVVEAHAVKDLAEVLGRGHGAVTKRRGGAWEQAIVGGAGGVHATVAHGDFGSASQLCGEG